MNAAKSGNKVIDSFLFHIKICPVFGMFLDIQYLPLELCYANAFLEMPVLMQTMV